MPCPDEIVPELWSQMHEGAFVQLTRNRWHLTAAGWDELAKVKP